MRPAFVVFAVLAVLSACSGAKTEAPETPKDASEARREARGKITGEEGFVLAGGKRREEESSPLGVNSFLWRATLDTLSFMPLISADPFGGVIITDWHEDPKTPGERFKVNALILDKTLRADGVKITVFKQSRAGGSWRDMKVDPKVERTLEDTILTRARQLKIGQIK